MGGGAGEDGAGDGEVHWGGADGYGLVVGTWGLKFAVDFQVAAGGFPWDMGFVPGVEGLGWKEDCG